jgi:Fe-Mn family superoxide dismutase
MRFQLPTLPFNTNALAPFLTEEAIDVHYNGHHANYVKKVNELLEQSGSSESSLERIIQNVDGELFNNAAQAWNHTFLWHGLCPLGVSDLPEDGGDFDEAIEKSFGSMGAMKKAFVTCASHVFGSGYVWLTAHSTGHLEFITTQNADNPIRFENMRPLWNCDLWEHAYYIDYRNNREDFVAKTWDHVNWDFAEENFLHEGVPNMTKFMVASGVVEKAMSPHSAPTFD